VTSNTDREYAEHMVKRIIVQGKEARDMTDLALPRLRLLFDSQPSMGGRFGVSLSYLASLDCPQVAFRKVYVQEISSTTDRKAPPGSNARRLRRAMELMDRHILPVTKAILDHYPRWEEADFMPERNLDHVATMVCGESRCCYGFLFASEERVGASMVFREWQLKNRNVEDFSHRANVRRDGYLRLVGQESLNLEARGV